MVDASAALFAKIDVNQSNASVDLKGTVTVRHSSSAGLKGILIVRHTATKDLYTKFVITRSVNLKGIVTIRHSSNVALKGIVTVRHTATKDLYAKFEAQAVQTLFAKFEAQPWAALKGILIIRHTATKGLYAKFKPAVLFSGPPRNLFGKLFVGVDATRDLYARFEITEEIALPAEFIVRHAATKNLNADFTVKVFFNEGWGDLCAKFVVSRSIDLYAKFEAQTIKDLYAKFETQAVKNLYAKFEIQSAVDLYAKFEAQAIENLFAKFEAQAVRNLYAKFESQATAPLKGILIVRHTTSTPLKGILIVRHTAAPKDLYAKFEAMPNESLKVEFIVRHSTTKDLQSDFYVRWPYRLWTSRRYINGVIDSQESLIGDAKLEDTIEGVMDDIKTYLAANQIETYIQWHSIEDVPLQIRRAATYGTVASLYARHTKTFTSRVIPSVAPVTITVKGDEWEAMEYWEDRFETMMQRYLAYVQTGKLFTSTADEEPVFTMEDIPPVGVAGKSWHEWIEG